MSSDLKLFSFVKIENNNRLLLSLVKHDQIDLIV